MLFLSIIIFVLIPNLLFPIANSVMLEIRDRKIKKAMEARMKHVNSALLLEKFPKLKAIKVKIQFYTKAGNDVRVN